jgi:hypothetical protein
MVATRGGFMIPDAKANAGGILQFTSALVMVVQED